MPTCVRQGCPAGVSARCADVFLSAWRKPSCFALVRATHPCQPGTLANRVPFANGQSTAVRVSTIDRRFDLAQFLNVDVTDWAMNRDKAYLPPPTAAAARSSFCVSQSSERGEPVRG